MPQASEDFKKVAEKYIDLFGLQDEEGRRLKVLAPGDEIDGQPYVYVDDTGVYLVGGLRNVVSVDPEFGVVLSGPIKLSANPDQIDIGGGYWKFNPMLLSMVPSSTPTPVPTLVKNTPKLVKGKRELKNILGGFESLLGFGGK